MFQLVVPSILQRQILNLCHEPSEGGHFGVTKTKARITENYWWPGLQMSVRAYISSCFFCKKNKKTSGPLTGELHPIPPPPTVFYLLGLDHLGPFKKTKSGNRHILVAIDHFSKWIIAKPVMSTSTTLVQQFLKTEVITNHSYPRHIITDRGTAFTSKSLQKQIEIWE